MRCLLLVLVRLVGAAYWNDARFEVGHARGPPLLAKAANDLIRRKLLDFFNYNATAFIAVRLGMGAELGVLHSNLTDTELTEELIEELGNIAGVYPRTVEHAKVFMSEYTAALEVASSSNGIVACFGVDSREAAVLRRWCSRCTFVENRALEPFYFKEPWSQALSGRKVLIVHPFAKTIREQYLKPVWNEAVLPRDLELKLLAAPMTHGANANPREPSWLLALEAAKREVDSLAPFDVALLGCGAYGLPLARYVYERHGVPAIYVGGGLQLLFGIKGRRWTQRPEWSGRFNEHWVHPSPEETPHGASNVEQGTYW